MSMAAFISFLIYSFVTSITPGPNNVMSAASGVNFGLKRSIPHILGVGFGFGFMVAIVGLGIGSLLSSQPLVYETLKLIGIGYLLYLAYKIFKISSVDASAKQGTPITFLQAALFQWVNPKAWIMAMGAVTAYLSSESALYWYAIVGVVYGIFAITCTGTWAWIGQKLQALIDKPKKLQLFNAAMAGLLVMSIIYPLIESVRFFLI